MKVPEDFKQKIDPKINDRYAELIAKRHAETLPYKNIMNYYNTKKNISCKKSLVK